MFKAMFIILITIFSPTACSNQNPSQEEEARSLDTMFLTIKNLAESINCEDPSDWSFTAYGSKACGGPQGFIAYSINLDTEEFLNLIEKHKTAEKEFNNTWGIVSDCSLPAQPMGIVCENGAPVFTY